MLSIYLDGPNLAGKSSVAGLVASLSLNVVVLTDAAAKQAADVAQRGPDVTPEQIRNAVPRRHGARDYRFCGGYVTNCHPPSSAGCAAIRLCRFSVPLLILLANSTTQFPHPHGSQRCEG